MPLIIDVQESELFDPSTNTFINTKPETVALEHSLVSISKWESKWHKAYLGRQEKTEEEARDYIRCMLTSLPKNKSTFDFLMNDPKTVSLIMAYIEDPMSATIITSYEKKSSRDVATSELIYSWMVTLRIPFIPCETWHLNRLLKLIEVCAMKNSPPKKLSKTGMAKRNAARNALNAKRRALYNTSG